MKMLPFLPKSDVLSLEDFNLEFYLFFEVCHKLAVSDNRKELCVSRLEHKPKVDTFSFLSSMYKRRFWVLELVNEYRRSLFIDVFWNQYKHFAYHVIILLQFEINKTRK